MPAPAILDGAQRSLGVTLSMAYQDNATFCSKYELVNRGAGTQRLSFHGTVKGAAPPEPSDPKLATVILAADATEDDSAVIARRRRARRASTSSRVLRRRDGRRPTVYRACGGSRARAPVRIPWGLG